MTTAAARELNRAALVRPQTADEAARSVELTIATSRDVGDGLVLRCDPAAVSWPAVVPVLLDHQNATDRMAGRLESLRFDGGQLIGRAVFADAPAADAGWQLARAGCAVSVGAQVHETRPHSRAADEAVRWSLRHVALVPQGQDDHAFTRSLIMNTETTASAPAAPAPAAPADQEPEEKITPQEARRQRQLIRLCADAGKPAELAEDFIARKLTLKDAQMELIRSLVHPSQIEGDKLSRELAEERRAAAARGETVWQQPDDRSPLERVLTDRLQGKGVRHRDLARACYDMLRQHPVGRGRDLAGMGDSALIARAYATSDFALALQSSAERTLLDAYKNAAEGIRAIARLRPLADFREVTDLRVSTIPTPAKKGEGGEYKSTIFTEEQAAVLKAEEYGTIITITRKAAANDDLDVFGRMFQEMGTSARRLEAKLLVAALATISFGGANSTTAANIPAAIAAATVKLRRQKDAVGEDVSFEPRVLLVAPEQEAEARQALADFAPTSYSDVQPFRPTLAVDPGIAAGTAYLVDSAYQPLVLGTIGDPQLDMNEEFRTGDRQFRVLHDAAAAKSDERSICKVTIS